MIVIRWLAVFKSSHKPAFTVQSKTHEDFTTGIETRPGEPPRYDRQTNIININITLKCETQNPFPQRWKQDHYTIPNRVYKLNPILIPQMDVHTYQ